MPFFNSKRFEIVDVTSQEVVELDAQNSLSFYIKDIFSNTAIVSVDYLTILNSGRTEDVQGDYVNVSNITGDVYTFVYTPTAFTQKDSIKFRIKIVDVDGDEHFLYTDLYKIVTT